MRLRNFYEVQMWLEHKNGVKIRKIIKKIYLFAETCNRRAVVDNKTILVHKAVFVY